MCIRTGAGRDTGARPGAKVARRVDASGAVGPLVAGIARVADLGSPIGAVRVRRCVHGVGHRVAAFA